MGWHYMKKYLGRFYKVEQLPHLMCATSLVVLIFSEMQFELYEPLKGTLIGNILVNEAAPRIAAGLSLSIVSAYLFYLIVDVVPRKRRQRQTLDVLNFLLSSVLHSYDNCHIFGHSIAINRIESYASNEERLSDTMENLKCLKSVTDEQAEKLVCAMQTADSRSSDFNQALVLAVNLSPVYALQWLVITDKVKLLASYYGRDPYALRQELDEDVTDEYLLDNYRSSICLHFLEFVEEVVVWRKMVVS
ncbi:hypothetical protein [Cobetia sp. QF-1]|uniref:hypothetical protein n=1 Tax=Cobetia sp. QF-1 TaxID=1969833 RepID=UPI000B53988B|nr:hypothetical protein [Cobetia sp. QF-1]